MRARQPSVRQWMIVDRQPDPDAWEALNRLPRGRGVLIFTDLGSAEMRRLRYLARRRGLVVASGDAVARVHNLPELRMALLRRRPIILLSPLRPTRSHPDWHPIARQRAAAMVRLAKRSLLALGGMDARAFAQLQPLGFRGWAGISAFRT